MADINIIVGERIAKGRRRRGWHQTDLGAAVGRSESWVGQIERGVIPLDSVGLAESIAAVLGLTLEHVLAFDVRCPPGPEPSRVSHHGRPRPPVPAVRTLEDSTSVERRTFVIGSMAGLTTALAGLPQDTADRIDSGRQGTIDAATVADLRLMAVGYRQAYRSVPATALLPLAQGQINLVLSLQPASQPERQRAALLLQLGEMAALAAVVSFLDLRDYAAGELAGRAFHVGYGGDREGGLDCALAAVDHAERGASLRMRAWAYAVLSEMHATVSDDYACRTALDTARTHLDNAVEGERWGGIGSFDLSKLDAYQGGDLVRLGCYEEALPALDTALQRLGPTMYRHRATAFADRADAHAAAGHPDAACEDAHQALSLLEQVHQAETLRRITALHRTLRTTNTPATRALAEHLIDVRSTFTAGSRT
jgi:transcriptional regulator with XRE-family HTH domain/tetratricopeptide (TPR) repeat protein